MRGDVIVNLKKVGVKKLLLYLDASSCMDSRQVGCR